MSTTYRYSYLTVAVLLALIGFSGCNKEVSVAPVEMPNVEVALPTRKSVEVFGEFVGQVDSPETIELRTRVEGYLKEICFHEGQEVEKGSLMFVIDPAQYEIAVQVAEAQLHVANAQVQTAVANLHQAQNSQDRLVMQANKEKADAEWFNAQQNLKENQDAHRANAVPRSVVESAEARNKQALAALDGCKAACAQSEQDYKTRIEAAQAAEAQARANVATATAQLEQAKLNLVWTRIYSPVKGRVGLCNVKIGALVGHSNDLTPLATVSLVDPIQVYFTVSERSAFQIDKLARQKKQEKLSDGSVATKLILENGNFYDHPGRIDFIDRTVDSTTGTLKMRAEFPNPTGFLRPGNYAKIQMTLSEKPDALLVDECALRRDLGGAYVLVVDDTDTVQQRPVKTGTTKDGFVVIESGVNANDRVIVKGLQRTRAGKKVKADLAAERVADNAISNKSVPTSTGKEH